MKKPRTEKEVVDQPKSKDEISRRKALIKTSKYAALTATSMLTFYSPKKAQAASQQPQTPGW